MLHSDNVLLHQISIQKSLKQQDGARNIPEYEEDLL